MGAAAGLIPCPSALVVLLGAIAQHQVALGLLLIVAFSAGLAMTLTALGLVVVYSRRAISRFSIPSGVTTALPALSAVVIVGVGFVLTANALPQICLNVCRLLGDGWRGSGRSTSCSSARAPTALFPGWWRWSPTATAWCTRARPGGWHRRRSARDRGHAVPDRLDDEGAHQRRRPAADRAGTTCAGPDRRLGASRVRGAAAARRLRRRRAAAAQALARADDPAPAHAHVRAGVLVLATPTCCAGTRSPARRTRSPACASASTRRSWPSRASGGSTASTPRGSGWSSRPSPASRSRPTSPSTSLRRWA